MVLCSSSGTGTTYINNSPRTTMITQIGTAGTFEWLDNETLTLSFIQAYQLNSGGTMSISTTILDSSTLTTSYVEYTFTFPSIITLSGSTGFGIIRSSGSGTFYIGQWLASQGGNLLDCVINQGWDDGAEGAGNLNTCIDDQAPIPSGSRLPPPPITVRF